jgi:excisionase family DNA binding protein
MDANTSARLFDIEQCAKVLRVIPATVRRRIADGQLEAYRVGRQGNIRVDERSLDELLVPYRKENPK